MTNLKRFYTSKIFWLIAILILVCLILGLYQIHTLKIAHSTFENYYKFRGCVELIEKTDLYGTCRTSSGEIIKIVRYQGRWFLDGDLPDGFLSW